MTYADLLSTINLFVTIIGLTFVIVSLWQARRSINAATYQHILDREAANWDQVRTGDILVRVRALQHFGINVSEDSYNSSMDVLLDRISLFNFYEGIYFQYRQGALNKEVWENWKRSLITTMKNNDIRKAWESVKQVYNPKFAEFINELAPLSLIVSDAVEL